MEVAMRSNSPDYYQRGLELQEKGNLDAAIRAYRAALKSNPNDGRSHNNLGNALSDLGQLEQAAEHFHRAIHQLPNSPAVYNNFGNLLRGLGKPMEAIDVFRTGLALDADLAPLHNNLGNALLTIDALNDAEQEFLTAITLSPNYAKAYSNLSRVLLLMGRVGDSISACRTAISLDDSYSAAHNNLGLALADTGDVSGAIECFEKVLVISPNDVWAWSNQLLFLNYDETVSTSELASRHSISDSKIAGRNRTRGNYQNTRDPERVLRIGYVSADFSRHPVGFFMQPLLEAHNRQLFQIYLYSTRALEDDLTAQLKRHCKSWHKVGGENDADLAQRISMDGIDILVDLAGHTAGNRLSMFKLRPAPIQISCIGYCHSTGSSAMDYIVMDAFTVPDGAEWQFVERVERLPNCRWCYSPPEYAPSVGPLPSLRNNFITFGCLNNPTKLGPGVVEAWSCILRALPGSRLLLSWKSLGDPTVKHRLEQGFLRHGIVPSRLLLRSGRMPHRKVLQDYSNIDIALDPFPFSGGLSSLEALWMGVPVIAMAGERPVSRQSFGILSVLGLQELTADNKRDYVNCAINIARDPSRLLRLRSGLRNRMAQSVLCNRAVYARDVEQIYRRIWRHWCKWRGEQ